MAKQTPRATKGRPDPARPPARKSTAARPKSAAAPRKPAAGRPKPAAATRSAPIKPIAPKRPDEHQTLLHLDELVAQRIVGRSEDIARVANTIRIRRTGLDFRPNRPDGAFLLVGPAGVGKTEFALAFGAALTGGDESVLVLDLADYSDEEDLAELLVMPLPGRSDTLVEGALTTPVRRNPRGVILLRGLEHAHRNFYRTLFRILDRGRIDDAQGEAVFDQTVIFATTRLHPDSNELVDQIGFNRNGLSRTERARRMLEEQFTPELVSVFNEVLYFENLTADDIRQIARSKVDLVLARLKTRRHGVQVSDKVYETFIHEDEVKRSGARFLNRALEEKLFTPLSMYLLAHARARRILVDVEGGQVVIREPAR
jgi:ATP-dependent Clp protease ATP-binding subunit ClpA